MKAIFTHLDKLVGLQEVKSPRIFKKSAHESAQVVSPTHRPPLPLFTSKHIIVLISVRAWGSVVVRALRC